MVHHLLRRNRWSVVQPSGTVQTVDWEMRERATHVVRRAATYMYVYAVCTCMRKFFARISCASRTADVGRKSLLLVLVVIAVAVVVVVRLEPLSMLNLASTARALERTKHHGQAGLTPKRRRFLQPPYRAQMRRSSTRLIRQTGLCAGRRQSSSGYIHSDGRFRSPNFRSIKTTGGVDYTLNSMGSFCNTESSATSNLNSSPQVGFRVFLQTAVR